MGRDDKLHFRILEDIAQHLSGEVNFPTCLDAAVVVRNTLKEPTVSLDRVAQVIGVEPLIASKLLRLANSTPYNPSGKVVADLKAAVSRLGFEAVRTTSLAVAMDQMMKSRRRGCFETLSRKAWEHSLHMAAISRVLARRLGSVNPDEALLAGMVHGIGVFYLLYRAAEFPEYQDNDTAVIDLLAGWHRSIGESLLQILGLPDHIVEAVRDHGEMPDSDGQCSLRDVLYFASLLAGGSFEWRPEVSDPARDQIRDEHRSRYADLMEEAEEDIRELRVALGA